MYIAPFVHELKAFFDESYDDGGPNLVLCREIQQYYERHNYHTKVKAAGLLTVEEAKALAGVTSMTVAPDLLRTLSVTEVNEANIDDVSLFRKSNKTEEARLERRSYVEDEKGWRKAYERAYDGKGRWKTDEVCSWLSGLRCDCCLLTRFQGYWRFSRVPDQGRAPDEGYREGKYRTELSL